MSVLRPPPPDTIAQIDTLAKTFQTQGQFALAEQHARQALILRQDAWGPEHLQVAPGLDRLADVYRSQGKSTEAEALVQRALAIRAKHSGAEPQGLSR
jgi:hypothetical protein